MHVGFDKAGEKEPAANVAHDGVRSDMLRGGRLVADVDDRVVAYDDRPGPRPGIVYRVDAGIDEGEVARWPFR